MSTKSKKQITYHERHMIIDTKSGVISNSEGQAVGVVTLWNWNTGDHEGIEDKKVNTITATMKVMSTKPKKDFQIATVESLQKTFGVEIKHERAVKI